MVGTKTVLILLLPCLVAAQILVEVKPGYKYKNGKTKLIPRAQSVLLTDKDLETLQLTPSEVKENLETKTTFKIVENVVIKDANEANSTLRKLNITLRQISVDLLQDRQRVKHAEKVLNNENMHSVVYNTTVMKLNESMTTKWFDTRGLSLSGDIGIAFGGLKDVSAFGKDSYASKAINENIKLKHNESDIGISPNVVLQPGETVTTRLKVKKAIVKLRINYEVRFSGDIYFEFDDCYIYHGYSCWANESLDINEYFKMIRQPFFRPYQIITYTSYFDPQVHVGKVKKKYDKQNLTREIIFEEEDFVSNKKTFHA